MIKAIGTCYYCGDEVEAIGYCIDCDCNLCSDCICVNEDGDEQLCESCLTDREERKKNE